MSTEVITKGLPEGWMIQLDWRYGGSDVDECYVAYRWDTRTTKKLFHKAVTRTGWFKAGYESHWERDTRAWILVTDVALKKEALS